MFIYGYQYIYTYTYREWHILYISRYILIFRSVNKQGLKVVRRNTLKLVVPSMYLKNFPRVHGTRFLIFLSDIAQQCFLPLAGRHSWSKLNGRVKRAEWTMELSFFFVFKVYDVKSKQCISGLIKVSELCYLNKK